MSRGLGDVYKRQTFNQQAFQQLVKLQDAQNAGEIDVDQNNDNEIDQGEEI